MRLVLVIATYVGDFGGQGSREDRAFLVNKKAAMRRFEIVVMGKC
jgi:hypothetical protein